MGRFYNYRLILFKPKLHSSRAEIARAAYELAARLALPPRVVAPRLGAVALGSLVYDERFEPVQTIGAVLMLSATWLAVCRGAPAIRRSGCAAMPPRDCR